MDPEEKEVVQKIIYNLKYKRPQVIVTFFKQVPGGLWLLRIEASKIKE